MKEIPAFQRKAVVEFLDSSTSMVESKDFSHRRFFSIVGQTFEVMFSRKQLEEKLSPSLQHLSTNSKNPEFRLFVLDDTEVEGSEIKNFLYSQAQTVPCLSPEVVRPRVHFSDGKAISGVYYPASDILEIIDGYRNIGVYWSPNADEIPVSELSAPFRFILHKWLSQKGFFIAHAGAVGYLNSALMLVGPGGSGKSTTTSVCIKAGMNYLGDDSVLCQVRPLPTVHCLYNSATLHGKDADLVHGGKGVLGHPGHLGEQKSLFFLWEIFRSKITRSLPLKAIVTLRLTGRRQTHFEPISSADVFRKLSPSSMFNIPGSGMPSFSQHASLANRVLGYELSLGTELHLIPDRIRELLLEVSTQ